jgi:Transposase IS4
MGITTHYYTEDQYEKKTVQIVKALVNQFEGSHHTIYVDRFYTSLDLMKALDKMDLHITGTCMQNLVNRELTITKRAARDMERGSHHQHLYTYETENGEIKHCGLVVWKDKEPVYCLTNDYNTHKIGTCTQRSDHGLLEMPRPKVIARYNTFMGGVDLADKQQLFCNSTIMGLNRWWLKAFFYLLDVATANSMILYIQAMPDHQKCNTLVKFKSQLIWSLLGNRVDVVYPPFLVKLFMYYRRLRTHGGHVHFVLPYLMSIIEPGIFAQFAGFLYVSWVKVHMGVIVVLFATAVILSGMPHFESLKI